MTRKLLLLICILSCLNISAYASSGKCGTNVQYSYDYLSRVFKVTGTGAMFDYSYESNRPWYSIREDIESVEISDGVTSIGYNNFYNCYFLKSVITSNSMTSIGEKAFKGCSRLKSITIGNSVKSIGYDAFYDCSGLTSVHITDLTAWCKIGFVTNYANPLYYAHHLFMNGSEIKDLVTPNNLTSIGEKAFYQCSGLSSVTIGNSVTSIGDDAFYGCSGLTSVTIGNSVMSIEDRAFYGCSGLTSVTIGNSVTSIYSTAFNKCSGLTNVTLNSNAIVSNNGSFRSIFGDQVKEYKIGNEVKSIGDNAFNQCSDVTTITLGSNIETIGDYALANIPKLEKIYCYAENVPTASRNTFENSYIDYVTLYVPASSLDAYKSTAPWKNAAQILPLEDIKEKCATPTILFENGKLSFICETEGVRFECNFSTPSESYEEGVAVDMPNKLQVSVYAKKDGYENSDVATKEIDLGTSGIRGDVNGDGVVNMPDAMFIVNKMLNGKFPDE